MLKDIICKEVTQHYKDQIEDSEEVRDILADESEILNKIYNTFGFEYGSKVETMICNLVNEMGDQMYINGLKDGAKLFG